MLETKVLIVDDDANVRTVLRDVLSSEPYQLLEAADGQHALEIAKREMPDLILLDIMMPGMDGNVVLRKLKESKKTRDIMVMMVTALNLDTQISACLDDGAIDHICKPFSSMVVRSRVRAALRSRTTTPADKTTFGKQGKVFGFIGAKGGVGTTSVAVNVALSLISSEKSVVLAEMRSHAGTIGPQFGVTSALNTNEILHDMEPGNIDADALSKIMTHHQSGIQLLLAPPDVKEDRELTSQKAEEIIRVLENMADCVVVDIPLDPLKVAKAALRCCHFVTLVVELESTALAAAKPMLAALDSWGMGGSLTAVALVQHIVPDNSVMTVAHARDELSCPLIGVIPPAPDAYSRALRLGSPVVESDPDSICADAFQELSKRLVENHIAAMAF